MAKKLTKKDYLKNKPAALNMDFGRIVAEEDPDLQQYYVARERYFERAMSFDDPAVFFIGPKGIGKSGILQMIRLERKADIDRVISISPDDLAFSAIANVTANTPILADAGKNQWLFKSLWDYVLALEILRREYKDKSSLASVLKGMLKFFFGNQHEVEAQKLLSISLSDDGAQRTLSGRILQLIEEVELSFENKESGKLAAKAKVDGSKLDHGSQLWLLNLINSVAKKISETVKNPYHILIDDLDKNWHDSPVQNAFIAALFTSLKNFSKPPNLKCAVAIRDQIFRKLPIIDRDKYHDWVCAVEWDCSTVQKMVDKRIHFKMGIPEREVWNGLFPPNTFPRLWRRSYGRPREAIRLIALCIREAAKNSHLAVEEDDINSGIRKFSDLRIAEIASEFQHQYPGLERITRKFAGWPKEFPLERFSEIAFEIAVEMESKDELAQQYTWAGGYVENAKGLAKVLFECGILLLKASRTDEPSSFDPERPLDIQATSWLAIHPAFGPALGLIGD